MIPLESSHHKGITLTLKADYQRNLIKLQKKTSKRILIQENEEYNANRTKFNQDLKAKL